LDNDKAIKELCRELEENSKRGRSRDLFKTLKRTTGEYIPGTAHVKSNSDKRHTKSVEMKERWREYVRAKEDPCILLHINLGLL